MVAFPFLCRVRVFCDNNNSKKYKNMNELQKQIEAQITWSIRMGLLPWNYRSSEDYNNLIKSLRDDS